MPDYIVSIPRKRAVLASLISFASKIFCFERLIKLEPAKISIRETAKTLCKTVKRSDVCEKVAEEIEKRTALGEKDLCEIFHSVLRASSEMPLTERIEYLSVALLAFLSVYLRPEDFGEISTETFVD